MEDGREVQEERDTCVYIAASRRCIRETNTTLQSNCTPIGKKSTTVVTSIQASDVIKELSIWCWVDVHLILESATYQL